MAENPLPGSPPDRVGRYRILECLGEGGMGTVYLAYDQDLGRRVALKWLKQATPATIERLRQEAHLHARVEHPAVCRLYQVDEWQGWPFLVMQYIQGSTLDKISPDLSLTTKLRLFATLADGVHAAHRQGLIHRDLKPSNLMVEADGVGGWRPYVMDFGLARDEASGSLTEAGMLLGSPAYMAPEQLRGWADVRTDVYGLGAALFALLAGRPPFLGSATEILVQTQTGHPPRLRDLVPGLPRDLDTVVETCMAKDPARRYPNVAAFRDDLVRFIDGEPVRARRVSALEKMSLWVRRNRLTSALAALVCVSMLATGLVWEISRRRAQARAYWAERFGREAMRMDSVVRFGRMLPPHDISRELAQVHRQMDAVRREMAQAPLSQGPGHFVLGQGYLLLGDPLAARPELEQAWAQGHRSAEVSLALGLCLTGIYEAELAKTLGVLNPTLRETRQAELRRDLLERGQGFLTQARQERGQAFSLVEETRMALADKRLDEASNLAQTAYEAEPWRYEALFYLAKALNFRARETLWAGREPEAKRDFERVLDLADAMGRLGPSDDRIQEVRQFAWFVGESLRLRGMDRKACRERALESLDALGRLNSLRSDFLNQHALVLVKVGEAYAELGQSPEPYYQRAEALMLRVTEAPLQGAGAYPALVRAKAQERLASLAHRRAVFALSRKADPRPFIEKGFRICEQAKTEGLAQWETYQNLSFLYMDLAQIQRNQGQECLESLQNVTQNFRDCANLGPSAASFSNLGESLHSLASRHIERGEDPRRVLDEAREALARAAQMAPGQTMALAYEGDGCLLEARWQSRQGRDPQAFLEQARRAFEAAQAKEPQEPWHPTGLAQVHTLRAELLVARHQDARAEAREALAYGRKALALKGESDELRAAMASARRIISPATP